MASSSPNFRDENSTRHHPRVQAKSLPPQNPTPTPSLPEEDETGLGPFTPSFLVSCSPQWLPTTPKGVGFFPWIFTSQKSGIAHFCPQKMQETWEKKTSTIVGGWVSTPFEKYESNWIISPGRDENKKYLKPPPSQEWLSNTSFFSVCIPSDTETQLARKGAGCKSSTVSITDRRTWLDLQLWQTGWLVRSFNHPKWWISCFLVKCGVHKFCWQFQCTRLWWFFTPAISTAKSDFFRPKIQ